MNYLENCPRCQTKLVVDDIDFNFKGNQDESLICPNCLIYIYSKIRYGKICKVRIEEPNDEDEKQRMIELLNYLK